MAKTAPTRVPDDLFDEAKAVAEVMSRSAAQQITHWARVGREVELAGLSVDAIEAVLAGRRSYDDLTGEEQAIVRAQWTERIDALRADLDLADASGRARRAYVERDDTGNVVRRDPSAESAAH